MTEEEKLERFKDGLKPEILLKVIEKGPTTFEEAVRHAEYIDVLGYTLLR
jgi:hypothetical protein